MAIYSFCWAIFLVAFSIASGLFATSPSRKAVIICFSNTAFLWMILPATHVAALMAAVVAAYLLDPWLTRWRVGAAILIACLVTAMLLLKPAEESAYRPILTTLSLSFFSFHMITHVLDRRSGQLPNRPPFGSFAAHILFFPSMVSGPIIRPNAFHKQILSTPGPRANRMWNLFFLHLCSGMAKKFVIADRLALVQADLPMGSPFAISYFYVLALRTYFDLSGYTDMARAVAVLAGIDLPQNFCFPFLAKNPVDFWRRWHISLSNFFRDYIYYPLFFHTKSIHLAAACTFLFNGLWHGLTWNYLLLGCYWSAAVILYLLTQRAWDHLMPTRVQIFVTIQIFVGSFIFFDPSGLSILSDAIFSQTEHFTPIAYQVPATEIVTAIAAWVILIGGRSLFQRHDTLSQSAGAFLLLLLPTSFIAHQPSHFIYSRF